MEGPGRSTFMPRNSQGFDSWVEFLCISKIYIITKWQNKVSPYFTQVVTPVLLFWEHMVWPSSFPWCTGTSLGPIGHPGSILCLKRESGDRIVPCAHTPQPHQTCAKIWRASRYALALSHCERTNYPKQVRFNFGVGANTTSCLMNGLIDSFIHLFTYF